MGGPLNAELVLGWSPVICLLRIKKMRPRRNNVSVPFRVWWKGGVFKQQKEERKKERVREADRQQQQQKKMGAAPS